MQTLDNLLLQNRITLAQYLERVPHEYVAKRNELLEEVKGATGAPPASGMPYMPENINDIPVSPGKGNGVLQQALNKVGA